MFLELPWAYDVAQKFIAAVDREGRDTELSFPDFEYKMYKVRTSGSMKPSRVQDISDLVWKTVGDKDEPI